MGSNGTTGSGVERNRRPASALSCFASRASVAAALAMLVAIADLGATTRQGEAEADGPRDLVLDRVEVQRVVVDLVAEQGGRPVLDLEAGELRVYVDGTEVEILGFSPPPASGREGSSPARASAPTAAGDDGETLTDDAAVAGPQTLVLFLDELHMKPVHGKRVLKQARGIADELIDAGGRVTVVAFDGKLKLLLPPSSDKKALRDVLDEAMDSTSIPMMASLADPARAIAVVHQRMEDETQEKSGGSPLGARPSGTDPCVDIGGLARTSAQQAAAATDQSIGGLRLLVGTLGRYPGRKSLLYVSDGVPLVPGMEVYTYAIEMCDGTAARQGLPNAVDTQEFGGGRFSRWDPRAARTEMLDFDTTRQWREIAAYANAQQVSIYPIQATGLQTLDAAGVSNVRTTQSFAQAALGNPRDSLFLIADETGGEAFFDTNRFGDALVEAASDAEVGYQITFEPLSGIEPGAHEIRVEVDRPGVQLRHRKSFTSRTAASRLVDLAVSALVFGRGDNPLGVRLDVGEPVATGGGGSKVDITVRVPLSSLALVPVGEDRLGRFTVAVGGRQSNGRYLPVGFKQIDVRASEVDQATQSFEYEIELPYRSDAIEVSVAVRDDVGGVEALSLASIGGS